MPATLSSKPPRTGPSKAGYLFMVPESEWRPRRWTSSEKFALRFLFLVWHGNVAGGLLCSPHNTGVGCPAPVCFSSAHDDSASHVRAVGVGGVWGYGSYSRCAADSRPFSMRQVSVHGQRLVWGSFSSSEVHLCDSCRLDSFMICFRSFPRTMRPCGSNPPCLGRDLMMFLMSRDDAIFRVLVALNSEDPRLVVSTYTAQYEPDREHVRDRTL